MLGGQLESDLSAFTQTSAAELKAYRVRANDRVGCRDTAHNVPRAGRVIPLESWSRSSQGAPVKPCRIRMHMSV